MHLLTKLFERNHGFLPLLRCIPDDRSSVLLPARPSRRLPHLDSEYAERTRTVCRMHDRACDASCCYRLAVTLLRLHCRLHRKPACLVRCGCTADSSLLSDDDEACKNSVIKIGPPDIDMPGNAKPGIHRNRSYLLLFFSSSCIFIARTFSGRPNSVMNPSAS